jgi:guanylate kinase
MNELRRIDEFRKVLDNYEFSEDAKQTLQETKLVLLTGASASGRNTIINELLKTGNYHFIISDTTRAPRVNNGVLEQNGVEYWFRDEDDMLIDIRNGEFLEAEVLHGRQVSGISMRELKKARDEHRVAITDVDIGGIRNVLELKPDTVAILVLPPSFEEWQRRITSRGEMSDEEFLGRLQTAARIFEIAKQNSTLKIIINNDYHTAAKEVAQLAEDSIDTTIEQHEAEALLDELLKQTKSRIAQLA